MKVTISHKETSGGVIRKVPYHEVAVLVRFTPAEQSTIQKYDLNELTVLKRVPPANVRKISEETLNLHHLKLQHLLRGTDSYMCGNPVHARQYHAEVKEALEKLKQFLDDNAIPLVGVEEFEL
jgi:hypothetical protein